MRIGYHASHEQFAPDELLALARRAEECGFDAAMCSDHFHPWSRAQGQSGYAWSWLGAALATTGFGMGVVCAPVGRYHPIVIAQAVATLEVMFPQRFWLAVGSGEALNEQAAGAPWPGKPARNQRLLEAVEVMRALWRGEKVSHDDGFVVRDARLFTRPDTTPKVLLAALTPETARWGGEWADGIVTLGTPSAPLEEVIAAFRAAGGNHKPVHVQHKLSFADSEEAALQGAWEQWRTNALPVGDSEELRTPEEFEQRAQSLTRDDVARAVYVSADPDEHQHELQRYRGLAVDAVYLHNVNREQDDFIETFRRRVLPALR
jgi:probable non-F420 flavinoid oxidoreductase